jgi:hypothetical protein
MVSVFPNDGIKNLAAVDTPEGPPGSVMFLFDHPSLAPMAFHGNLLQGMLERELGS